MKKLVVEISDLEETLARETVAATRNRYRTRTSGSDPHLNYPATCLWGGDAALDWLDSKWSAIQDHLLVCAQNGRSEVGMTVPQMGRAAKAAIQSHLEKVFPRSKVALHDQQIVIDWTDLTVPPGM